MKRGEVIGEDGGGLRENIHLQQHPYPMAIVSKIRQRERREEKERRGKGWRRANGGERREGKGGRRGEGEKQAGWALLCLSLSQ